MTRPRDLTARIALAACLVSVLACFGSQKPNVPIKPAPLESPDQARQLKALLSGQWEHKETRPNPEAEKVSGEGGMRWELNTNERFTFQQRSLFSGGVTGKWWLDGRNLHFQADGTATRSAYRIESWSSGRMIWYSYRENTYYMVERVGLIQASHSAREMLPR